MTVVSKYLDEAIVRYEKMGFSKHALSKGIVTIAVGAYVAHISYPYLSKMIKAANLAPVLSETASTTDDDTSDSDFDSESDDYESAIESNNINSNRIDRKNIDTTLPDGTTKLDGDDNLDNDETAQGVETDTGDRLTVPTGKRKRKHSKVIKQQIKQAEKFLAQATQERKKSEQVGNLSFSQLEERRIGLNLEFLFKLKRLIHIMIPRIWCREIGILGVHTACLISRTFLSIYVAAIEGSIVKFIVRRDLRQFIMGLMKWFSIAIPATFINSMIRYLENKLALSFRTRLVNHSYKLYFKNQTYYRVANLDGRIENADHRLTEDISVFTSSIAHLYSHLTKPCFDLMLIGLALMRSSRKMKANIVTGPALAFVVISATALILRQLSPKFGQLVAEEATRYGYLRHVHARVITNAEEIAFYGGQRVELMQLREAFRRLANQMNIIYTQRLWFVMLEQFFMKYVWSGTGMIMISLPVLMGNQNQPHNNSLSTAATVSDDGISDRTQYLTTARNLLISGADAIERLMSSYKEIVALAGYTYRVAGMLEVFDDTAHGRYNKVMMAEGRNNAGIIEFRNGQPVTKGRIIVNTDPNDRSISLNNVPVVTPNCDIVVPSLTLRIEPGMHLLITGPNGCGKSSLFRIVNGLWPIYGGELYIPKPIVGKPSMFYIPQRPYLTIGNLRDQIIYPDTVDDMLSKKYDEDMLHDIMKTVSLEHIVARDSFDVVRDWKDILSGGEKQRMAIARLFYHKPQYALLDECTSAVSIDVESSIYEAAKTAGITLLTITHRPTLWKFHTHILQFDGQGGWDFKALSENDTQQKVPLNKKQ
ncbi:ATP-binding cassette sub-family D member 1 [Sitodiplosis mosellana]|uniref:ATP-binding cassette sub-family D member 1 n=1 Tax=Sitodiplosis mosellana TaxID=263140 RepID=UPI0024448528|nr:ATP-binding cassette sub-family D member 1 [Sitodiplosis mosellana]XP_055314269.1 ATP-binding cassette sub-family D member 1 [Sitodiplosis mosellana]XP_055314270.1 ATP-binding cassette sub-family D member 1 [Sitodiplosis mosellana]XP_055314271.1 ATP-binding cassette sub-family D member 1 [Sitodiplosis mosellana]XP_055314273.1 ATP-binding cassette sub-family D member 1 [Sitodiplosis mosellana]XP_055314274.1 ATP-binding cassette sub-family D member 1 [Sitodiplosis mosellana]XP_055314275.1 AT